MNFQEAWDLMSKTNIFCKSTEIESEFRVMSGDLEVRDNARWAVWDGDIKYLMSAKWKAISGRKYTILEVCDLIEHCNSLVFEQEANPDIELRFLGGEFILSNNEIVVDMFNSPAFLKAKWVLEKGD